jgi:hypothetical protein
MGMLKGVKYVPASFDQRRLTFLPPLKAYRLVKKESSGNSPEAEALRGASQYNPLPGIACRSHQFRSARKLPTPI